MEDINALIYIQNRIMGESKEGNEDIEDNHLFLREKYGFLSKIFGYNKKQ